MAGAGTMTEHERYMKILGLIKTIFAADGLAAVLNVDTFLNTQPLPELKKVSAHLSAGVGMETVRSQMSQEIVRRGLYKMPQLFEVFASSFEGHRDTIMACAADFGHHPGAVDVEEEESAAVKAPVPDAVSGKTL